MTDWSYLLDQSDQVSIRLHFDLLICLEELSQGLKVSDDELKYAIYRIDTHLQNVFCTDTDKNILNNIRKSLQTLRS